MRAINKTCDKATAYKAWIDGLCQNAEECTCYRSSGEYVKDIKANLLIIQGGLCAYTEMKIDNIAEFNDDDWTDGRWTGNAEFIAQLDHFDSGLRDSGRESWLWENFFCIHPTINNIKRDRLVSAIVKPDNAQYAPRTYFEYDIGTDRYILSDSITDQQQRDQIQHMIDKCLLLNYGPVQRLRKGLLDKTLAKYYAGIGTLDGLSVDEFVTALEMTIEKLKAEV